MYHNHYNHLYTLIGQHILGDKIHKIQNIENNCGNVRLTVGANEITSKIKLFFHISFSTPACLGTWLMGFHITIKCKKIKNKIKREYK